MEKVSTVGVRNQVTLPKVIRKKAKIKEKMVAYIQAKDKDNFLVITLDPPKGVYNKIKISEKGQLVIPKNLRESKNIKKGNNLVFSIKDENVIAVKKLIERRKEKNKNWRWQFLVDVMKSLETVPSLINIRIEDKSLALVIKKGQDIGGEEMLELVNKMEKILGMRLLVEKQGLKINLRPMSL
jgi:AbrB family looped-hinge helix DNA binding protein